MSNLFACSCFFSYPADSEQLNNNLVKVSYLKSVMNGVAGVFAGANPGCLCARVLPGQVASKGGLSSCQLYWWQRPLCKMPTTHQEQFRVQYLAQGHLDSWSLKTVIASSLHSMVCGVLQEKLLYGQRRSSFFSLNRDLSYWDTSLPFTTLMADIHSMRIAPMGWHLEQRWGHMVSSSFRQEGRKSAVSGIYGLDFEI